MFARCHWSRTGVTTTCEYGIPGVRRLFSEISTRRPNSVASTSPHVSSACRWLSANRKTSSGNGLPTFNTPCATCRCDRTSAAITRESRNRMTTWEPIGDMRPPRVPVGPQPGRNDDKHRPFAITSGIPP